MLPKALRARLTVSRRGVLNIILGTLCGQVLVLAGTPVLSRLYDPADFGIFTITVTLAATVSTVAALRFELAVPLPRAEPDAYALVFLGLLSAASAAVLGTLGVALLGGRIAEAFNEPELRSWLWVVPGLAAVMAAVVVLNQLAARHRRYAAIGRRNLYQSVGTVLAQVSAGFAGVQSGGLIVGQGIGHAVAAASLVRGGGFSGSAASAGAAPARLRRCAVGYRRFPILLAPSGLLNILGGQLPVLIIAYCYGATVAGWLGLTQRVLAMPVALVGAAVAQVYLAEFSRIVRDDPAHAQVLFRRASRLLAVVAAAGGLIVLMAGPALFPLVFGQRWNASGGYAQALAISMATQFVAAPLSQTLIVLNRQAMQFAWDAVRFVVVTGAVTVAALLGWSDHAAVWALGTTSALLYLVNWLVAHRALRRERHGDSARPQVPVAASSGVR
ncbi:Membrane protein involved in the export of O-antigen and teichoic acid [Micromonospora echinaurantiaca]|uniref:Membrane protein involved in the export of O-antigen and teichoic acid n=1 Tax=Micromonospora echinaurantiaca TaxID=47857 RepID=A0A1C5IYG0_9ACTN|nr:oligosaccharide flippase family protein [Micromonospora echinaurantiaca]SCG62979.1 Membrane protein involved in the export of O-antigen and teichoic acid [Micromonospora echinaurantiaca]